MDDDGYLRKLRGVFVDEWRKYAACASKGDALFIHEEADEEGATLPMDEARAAAGKAVCAVCPVRIECLDDALFMKDIDMMRGGLTYEEQGVVARHRNRYLPNLNDDVTEAMRG